MSQEDIDLDITNYTINDIEYFFGLDANPNYNADEVEQREYEVRTQLFNGGNFNSRFKRTFADFLAAAKIVLINKATVVNGGTKPTITSIANNTILDNTSYPVAATGTLSRNPELIQHPETPFYYSSPSEFFPGNLNPLNTRILNKCLTIDTRFRENPKNTTTSSDFVIQLPTKLLRVVTLQLTSIEFPVSFYGISESYGNNFLNITVEHYVSSVSTFTNQIFIIPDGNYTNDTFIDAINTVLGSISGPVPTNIFSYVQFSWNLTNGRTTVVSLDPTIVMSITMDFSRDITGQIDKAYPLSARIGWNLGFTEEVYSMDTTYTSEALIDPRSIRYVYLSVEDFNNNVNNSFITAFSKSLFDANILARITVNKGYFELITKTDGNLVTESRQYFGPVDISRLHVRLYDDHGRILNMNNMNYTFGLTFKQIYNL